MREIDARYKFTHERNYGRGYGEIDDPQITG